MNDGESEILAAALESMDAGIGVYDAGDRLVAYNSSYARLCSAMAGEIALGDQWGDLLLASIRAGAIPEAVGREDEWLEHRRQLRGAYSVIHQLPDGRSFQVNERRMPNGGIAVVWTNVTSLVQRNAIADIRSVRHGEVVSYSPLHSSGSSLPSYDPNELSAKAQRWRELALQADPAHRETYLRLATKCELLVRQSIDTPPVAD